MLDNNDYYTNLALLLSDQNPFTIKLAVYQSYEKENFLDRKEFTGSILEIYDKVIEYLKINSATYGIIDSSVRIDKEEFPEFILREIVHFQRFGEGLRKVQEELDPKNFYQYNPGFDRCKK